MDEPDATPRRAPSWWRTGLAGLLAAGLALAIGELVAGFSWQLSSPVISVGNRVVDAVPRQVKDFAIETFGTNDKKALLIGIYSFAAVLGFVIGVLGGRRFVVGAIGIGLFGAVGVWAAGLEVDAPLWAGVPSIVGALAGITALALLLATIADADHPALVDRALAPWLPPSTAAADDPVAQPAADPVGQPAADPVGQPVGDPVDQPAGDPVDQPAGDPVDQPAGDPVDQPAGDPVDQPVADPVARRGFLKMSGAVVIVGAVAAAGGRWLQARSSAVASRLAVVLPKPKRPAAPLAERASVHLDGVSPFITPNADFYRIDTNLTVPQLATDDWTLTIKGMVDREVELTYDEVLAMDLVEERITIACVSNEVGGGLVGTASWLGVPLKGLLDRAGIHDGADQIVGRAFDGFTTGFPVDTLDGRPAMLAVGMNGEPLPLAHGFPARMIVSGLYGFVSATKWLTEIELTTFDAFDQYWVQRGWSDRGPIKTMARIDTPRGLGTVKAGRARVGGVAWAPTRGIERVEVRLDDGEWTEATLAAEDSTLTWRQWVHEFDATPGRHQVTCRATDGTGETQPGDRARPFPDGATGWHTVAFLVA